MLRRRHHVQEEAVGKAEEGKARMREYGNVSIPQEAFIATLRIGEG